MNIRLNGKNHQFDDVKTIYDIVHLNTKNISRLVTELNGEIIKQTQWQNTFIKDGDSLELVALVAGG